MFRLGTQALFGILLAAASSLAAEAQRVGTQSSESAAEASNAKSDARTGVVTAGRDGFSIRSVDGDFNINFGGYVQSDGRFYANRNGGRETSSFLLRRVRPSLQGTLYRYIDFRVTPDFGGGSATVVDAYLDLRFLPQASLRAGKFKAPVGLEQLQSDQDVPFIERGLPTNLVPNRDVGVQLSGDVSKRRLHYALAVYNGAPDGASEDADTNSGKDYAARFFATPFRAQHAEHPLRGLGFGVAASLGKQAGAVPTLKTPGQVPFFSYASGVTAAGARTRYSPQAYYYHGPLGVMFEFVRSWQRVARGSSAPVLSNAAWQVAATYYLTGEQKSFKGDRPLRDFDPARKGWGAFEIVARLHRLAVDPAAFSSGFADPARSAHLAFGGVAGINWHLNRNVRIAVNFSSTKFSGGAAGGDRPRENALITRFQIGF